VSYNFSNILHFVHIYVNGYTNNNSYNNNNNNQN